MTFALDWRSACLACTTDPAWRRKIWRGGLLLMVPVVGWPLVLGYRRLFVERVLDGEVPLLPEWRGNHRTALGYGLAAMAVIHAWYTPLYLWLLALTADLRLWAELPWAALVFVGLFSVFSTLLVPAWLAWLRFGTDVAVPSLELTCIGVAFVALTFFIPAGFLNVARTRRIATAFDVPSGLRQIRATPVRYVEAWLGSGVTSLVAHCCLPLAPWAVVWCYLAIIYGFTELPRSGGADFHSRSWYDHLRRGHWQHYRVQRSGCIERYELRSDRVPPTGAPETAFVAACLGPLRFPLPRSLRAQDAGSGPPARPGAHQR